MTPLDEEQPQDSQSNAQEPTPAELAIQSQLTQMDRKMQESNQVQQMLATNPQVAELLKAQQEGRQVVISDSKSPLESKPVGESDEYDLYFKDLDNSSREEFQEPEVLTSAHMKDFGLMMQKQILASVGDMIKAQAGTTEDRFISLSDSIENTSAAVAHKDLEGEINGVMLKYADAQEYGEDMIKLRDIHPTLNVEDLYKMAKLGRVGFTAPVPDQEKPINHMRSPRRHDPSEKKAVGKDGFRAMIRNAQNSNR